MAPFQSVTQTEIDAGAVRLPRRACAVARIHKTPVAHCHATRPRLASSDDDRRVLQESM